MIEVQGDLWTYRAADKPVICITTNGFVKANGEAVMGRGCAKEAAMKFRNLPSLLGQHIKEHGNVLGVFSIRGFRLITFPVKHFWMEPADPKLIIKSAADLEAVAQESPDDIFLLPRPGCGNGQLYWDQVRPLIQFLPDNVLVITHGGDDGQTANLGRGGRKTDPRRIHSGVMV